MTLQIGLGGVHVPWQMLLAAVVAAGWAVIALLAIAWPSRMRTALGISTFVLAATWLYAFDFKSAFSSKDGSVEAATLSVKQHQGSCASIRNDMTADQVRSRLGPPDETRNDAVVRGPGTTVLIYRDLRCAVHLFDDKVELID